MKNLIKIKWIFSLAHEALTIMENACSLFFRKIFRKLKITFYFHLKNLIKKLKKNNFIKLHRYHDYDMV